MEKKIFGIILTLGGAICLILGAIQFLNTGTGVRDIKMIIIYAVLGIIFFFAGIRLMYTTKDKS